jgi:2-dehydro-3-deoxygluconokinase
MEMNLNRGIVTFGESLMRLSPPDHLRLRQASTFDLVYGGAEANVAISLANFGLAVQYVTRLPENELGLACMQFLRKHGVGTDFIQFGGDRLGIYFLEVGHGKRPSRVIYDRAHSSFATLDERAIQWQPVFSQAGWFHWSGINPAVSPGASRATAEAVGAARQAGLTISCDLNYRHSLWKWGASPEEIMPGLVRQCDVLAANTAYLVLGLPDLPQGTTPDDAIQACDQLSSRFPNLRQIAMTCREAASAVEQRFTAVLWHDGRHYVSPTLSLTTAVDRIGAGDAFMAGLIYGLATSPDDPQRAVSFAAASAVLKHTIVGDASLLSVEEIERLLLSQEGFEIIR